MRAIEIAFERRDYAAAERLIATLAPDDVWMEFYQARLWEGREQWDRAETQYKHLLQNASAPKVVLAARQGIQRIQEMRQQLKQEAIQDATATPEKAELGLLILQAIPTDQQPAAVHHLTKIFNLDPYTARLLIPSRGIKLYRCGPLGEMEYYGQQLKSAEIPTFWLSFKAIETIPVYSIAYLEQTPTTLRAIVHPSQNAHDLQTLNFQWSDITLRVEGAVPIFEEVVERDSRGKLKRKEQTQDYAHLCDLHLSTQNCILRLCDATYQFKKGIQFGDKHPDDPLHYSTSYMNWRALSDWLTQQCSAVPLAHEFETFASTALDHPEMLLRLNPHLNLFRRSESPWDSAFQLYSSLLFLNANPH